MATFTGVKLSIARNRVRILVLLASSCVAAAQTEAPLERIAFGSCFRLPGPTEVWEGIGAEEPQLLLMLGDNVYADTEDMDVMRARYAELAAIPAFEELRQRCRVLAVWDDHDYGENDAGAGYPKREEARQIFLDFWKVPLDSPRRSHTGIYDSVVIGPEGKRVQILLLDTRSFRDPLTRRKEQPKAALGRPGPYQPDPDPERTLLGKEQWAWLRRELAQPAELRILVSSIQVVSEDHGWEKWANFPSERMKLLATIRDARAEGVVIISGDRHLAELSVLDLRRSEGVSAVDVGYPLIDFTSSSLNAPSEWRNELNRHRVGSPFFEANFGWITIDWEAPDPLVALAIRTPDGAEVIRQELVLSQLRQTPTSQR